MANVEEGTPSVENKPVSVEEESLEQTTVQDEEVVEPEVDLEKVEEERRREIEAEIEALEDGPLKKLRTHGLPATVYKITDGVTKEVEVADIVSQAKEIGVYFSASWCDPCQEFTPKLIEAYNKINTEKYAEENKSRPSDGIQAFEVIIIPVDRTAEEHARYFEQMPWFSVNYDGVAYFRMKLCEAFGLETIPSLLMFDAETGDTLTEEGVDAVERHGETLDNYPWKGHTKPMMQRFIQLVISKLPLLAVMAFMMFRNYTNSQQISSARTTTTTTTAAIVSTILKQVTDQEL